MDLDVVFLGTGGSVPSARRNTASILVRRGGDRVLFDCGEGTQRQMQKSVGLVQAQEIFITHLHADHYLGLPGLLKTWDMQDRDEPLTIYGPRGLHELFKSISRVVGKVDYEFDLIELNAHDSVDMGEYVIRSFPVEHRITALGYTLEEDDRPGRFDPELARDLGVAEGPDFGRLQRGEAVKGSDGTVHPEQVMDEDRPSRKLVITGDTRPCEETVAAAEGADLLVHDGTFTDDEEERAHETGHSTARQAAQVARDAEAEMLALVHISARHFIPEVVESAREVFENSIAPRDFDLVELPFPEKGKPELIQGGAKERREVERA